MSLFFGTPLLVLLLLFTRWTPVEEDFDGVTMVLVPAGCFMMGDDQRSNTQPIHEQCFEEPFWIDQTEVTQADFARLDGQKERPHEFSGDDLPVEFITWFEARDFCQQRGMRLPTEREWEYAARGVASLAYPWGDDWDADLAVVGEEQTTAVGNKPDGASWVGALDMGGNVWEWVSSLYAAYPYTDDAESTTDTDSHRVVRGGSFSGTPDSLRGAHRNWIKPNTAGLNLGFRCANDVEDTLD